MIAYFHAILSFAYYFILASHFYCFTHQQHMKRNVNDPKVIYLRMANQQKYCTTISILNLKEILHKQHNILAQWVTCLKETELQETKFIYSSPRSPCAEMSHISNFLDRFHGRVQKAKHCSKAETSTSQYTYKDCCLPSTPASSRKGR